MSAAGAKDIWTLAAAEAASTKKKDGGKERTIVVLGDPGSGKTSFITTFLDIEHDGKSTGGLGYNHGRKNAGLGYDTVHVFEVGGGRKSVGLLEAVITPHSLQNLCAIIVVDFSKPAAALEALAFYQNALRARVSEVLSTIERKRPAAAKKLRDKSMRAFKGHADVKSVKGLGAPCIVVSSRMDVAENHLSGEQMKVITHSLRDLCHRGACTLAAMAPPRAAGAAAMAMNRAAGGRIRMLVSHYAYGGKASREPVVGAGEWAYCPVGTDTLAVIGHPPGGSGGSAEGWISALSKILPEENMVRTAGLDNGSGVGSVSLEKFKEAAVDSALAALEDLEPVLTAL